MELGAVHLAGNAGYRVPFLRKHTERSTIEQHNLTARERRGAPKESGEHKGPVPVDCVFRVRDADCLARRCPGCLIARAKDKIRR